VKVKMSEVSPAYWIGYIAGIALIVYVVYRIVKYLVEKAKGKKKEGI